jgi:hypothetical protein
VRLDHVARFIVNANHSIMRGGESSALGRFFCVTLEFGSLSQIAMSSALKAFTRGMFTFAEIIIAAGVVSSLAAIALLGSLGLGAFPRMGKKTVR